MDEKKLRNKKITITSMLIACYLIIIYISGLLGYAEHTIPPMQSVSFITVYNAYETNSKSIIHAIMGLPYCANYLLVLSFLYVFIVLVIWGYQKSRAHDREGIEQGAAKFMTASQFARFIKKYADPIGKRGTNGRHNTILAKGTYLSFEGYKTKRNSNILATGGTGTGKTRYLIIPNMLQANTSYIVADISGELAEGTLKTMEMLGIETKVLNLVHLEQSFNYNPFDYIRTDSKAHKEGDIDKLVSLLLANTVDEGAPKGEKFWEDTITALYSACIAYLIDFGKPEERNLTKVLEMVNSGRDDETDTKKRKAAQTESDLVRLFRNAKEKEEMEIKAGHKSRKQMSRAFKSFDVFMVAKPEVRKNILISASVRIAKFSIQAISDLTSTNYEQPERNINAWEIAEKQMCIYIYTATAEDSMYFLASLFYSQLFDALYYRAENVYNKKFLIQDRDGFPIMTMFNTKKEASDMLLDMQQNAYIRKVGKVEREYAGTPVFYDTEELLEQMEEDSQKEKWENSITGKITNKIGNALKNKAHRKTQEEEEWDEEEEVEINDYGEEVDLIKKRQEVEGFVETEILDGAVVPAGRYMYQVYLPITTKKEIVIDEKTDIYQKKSKNKAQSLSTVRQDELNKRRKEATEEEGVVIKQFYSKKMAQEYLDQIKNAIIKKGSRTCPWHIRFLFDEFAQLTIPRYSERLSTVRKYNISCMTILQNNQQLDEKYEKSKETIKGNCDVSIFLGSNSVATAKEVSEQLGTTTNKTKGVSTSKNGTSISYTPTQRALKDTTELITMENDQCTISFRGEMPMLKEKYDCIDHPRYNLTGLYDDLNKMDEEYANIFYRQKVGKKDVEHLNSTKSMLTQEFADRQKAIKVIENKMMHFIENFVKQNPSKNAVELALQDPAYAELERELQRVKNYHLKDSERSQIIPKILDVSCSPKDFGFLGQSGENVNNLAIAIQKDVKIEEGQMDVNTYSEQRDAMEQSQEPILMMEDVFMAEF